MKVTRQKESHRSHFQHSSSVNNSLGRSGKVSRSLSHVWKWGHGFQKFSKRFILCVWAFCIHVRMCTSCMQCLYAGQRKWWTLWNWSYGHLGATTWVLRTKAWSSARGVIAFQLWGISPAPNFKHFCWGKTCPDVFMYSLCYIPLTLPNLLSCSTRVYQEIKCEDLSMIKCTHFHKAFKNMLPEPSLPPHTLSS